MFTNCRGTAINSASAYRIHIIHVKCVRRVCARHQRARSGSWSQLADVVADIDVHLGRLRNGRRGHDVELELLATEVVAGSRPLLLQDVADQTGDRGLGDTVGLGLAELE